MASSEKRITHRNVWTVLASMLILGVCYGLSSAVVSLHLRDLGFGKAAIGWLATAFAAGIALGSLPASRIIDRLGTKGAMLLGVSGFVIFTFLFPFARSSTTLAALRALDGAFSVVVWIAAETEMLRRTSRAHKGFVMSLYAISLAIGYVVGPLCARLITAEHHEKRVVFHVSAALAVACLMVLMTLIHAATAHGPSAGVVSPGDTNTEEASLSSREVLRRIRCSAFATFAYGYFQISVVALLPIFLVESRDIPEDRTILLTALFAFGMLTFSNVAGRLGDRWGHLRVMRTLAFVGMLMVASFSVLRSFSTMAVAVTIAGASLASLSPLSLGLLGKVVPAGDLHRAGALYNSFFAVGMLVGPPISGTLFRTYGGEVMLLHLAGLWGLFVAFATRYAGDDRPSLVSQTKPATASG